MSTRCQTFIRFGNEPVATIYRHCDGYPKGMGLDLCAILSRVSSPNAVVKAIIGSELFDAEIEPINAKHGDTEYEYYVTLPNPWDDEYRGKGAQLEVKDLYEGTIIKGTPQEVANQINNK